jgi:sec-independent protein translocase protein TatA
MFFNLQPGEMMVLLVVAVLLFGKRLPEVGRSLGKGIIEFKKGLRGIEDEFDSPATSAYSTASASSTTDLARVTDDAGMISVPKFEPPTSAPTFEPAPESSPTAG